MRYVPKYSPYSPYPHTKPYTCNIYIPPPPPHSQLNYLLTWTTVSPVIAIKFFSRNSPTSPITAQYAVRVLASHCQVNVSI